MLNMSTTEFLNDIIPVSTHITPCSHVDCVTQPREGWTKTIADWNTDGCGHVRSLIAAFCVHVPGAFTGSRLSESP